MKTNKPLALYTSNSILVGRNHLAYSSEVKQQSNPSLENIENLQFINSNEAAAFLGISRKFLMNLTSDGRVPYFKFGRSNKYLKKELAKLILENRRGPNGIQKR